MPDKLAKQNAKENDQISALVQKAKTGDENAFGNLYELYFQKIFKFVYYRVSHKEIAEDITEDVFVKAWTKIKSVKDESFNAWLYSIAKNRIIDHYRQQKVTVDIFDLENILESEQNISAETDAIIDKRTFLKLLKQLSPEQQIIIKLKFIEELENDEIAELISKTEGSIRVLQHRAITRLQELLDRQIQLKLLEKRNAQG